MILSVSCAEKNILFNVIVFYWGGSCVKVIWRLGSADPKVGVLGKQMKEDPIPHRTEHTVIKRLDN